MLENLVYIHNQLVKDWPKCKTNKKKQKKEKIE